MRLKRILCLLTLLAVALTALPLAGLSALASSRYYIVVDTTNQMVTVYDRDNTTDAGIARQMICSTGKSATPTPTGTFSLPNKTYNTERTEWYYFSEYNCYAKWATRIYKGILFHSVLFSASKKGPTSSSTKALGKKASHGCVRLRVEDAQWIALNCPAGTQCKIYASGAKNEDLRKRLLSRSFSRDSESYDQYMGRAAGTSATVAATVNLSKGKKGAQVGALQSRLRGLGFYGGAVDSKFGGSTKTAVKAFQAAVGLKKTGKVNTDLWNRIFSDAAPTGALFTLGEGWQGPCVAVLQQEPTYQKLFGGAVDGNYGPDTTAAVALYQLDFNLPQTGLADPAMQLAASQKAAEVRAQFAGAAYQLETSSQPVTLAMVKAKSSVKLRARASTRGKSLAKLRKNWQVKVLADLGSWVQVQYNGTVGYVQSKSLSMFPGTEVVANYVPVPQPTPSLPGVEEPVVLAAPAEEEGGVTLEEPTPEPTTEPTPEPTEEPAAEQPVEEPVTEEPAAEQPATEEPAAEEPVEEPVAEEPLTEEPVTEEPAEEPVTEEPVTEEPAEESVTEEPVAEQPVEEPVTEEPVAEQPVEEPVVEEPVAEEPAAEEPAVEPVRLPKFAVTLVEDARLYAAVGDAEPMALASLGAALEVTGAEGDWIAVAWEDRTAWIAAGDVSLTDALPEIVPAEEAAEASELVFEPGTEPVEEMPPETDDNESGLVIEVEPVVEENAGEVSLEDMP